MTSSDKKKNGKKARPETRDHLSASPASSFKKKTAHTMELPSGNFASVRRLGPTAVLSEGVMPDALMPIIQDAIRKGKGEVDADVAQNIASDPKQIAEMMAGIDRLMPKVFVEPKVLFHRHEVTVGSVTSLEDIPEESRDPEVVYTDDIDMNDKLFLFKFVMGGSGSLEEFRKESEQGLGTVVDGEEPEDASV